MKEKKKRLFFALNPDDETRLALSRLYKGQGLTRGRQVHVADLHITLQFLGSATAKQEACVIETAGKISCSPFTLQIDHVDYWGRPRIVWAGVSSTPAALSTLVSDLNENLELCGFEAERRAYKPHITLLRKAPRIQRQLLPEPITWPVKEFSLMASSSGGDLPLYSVVHRWEAKK